MAQFQFQPKWKEKLVCSHPAGSFSLDMPMGVVSVILPSEASWPQHSPPWARSLWPQLHAELSAWCASNNIPLHVEVW
ncbi:hypothetical protein [Pseudoxanthomonas sp. PXM02]|uniref:hypothetical protein n=1 Tax=Pseudoxanthomonas sp. PXM02 TaxID=2769294 RepID=UPI001782F721|nr:hypothetical protein [Pseudoxanthomonas sp. PXM02]MBD9478106.1 hypothetical protein [Pseudoxanthomonas sp. PXM02]